MDRALMLATQNGKQAGVYTRGNSRWRGDEKKNYNPDNGK